MKNILVLAAALSLFVAEATAFCGFYVAKADAKLFNESSKVILARNGTRTVITMSSDFKGDVKDFAMVVPVPVILKESDIRVADQSIFDKLDAYSAPRLAEYYDPNPCYQYDYYYGPASKSMNEMALTDAISLNKDGEDYGVKIEAKYTVGEYDILILSAEESGGLKIWLTKNGYKIPAKAEEVLEPYIKSGMKFFVVKVNLEEQEKLGYQTLRPLQMSFESAKFMLPLRLGMANANGFQDMIVFAFTKTGRVEATNYRTAKLPTDKDIPLFVENKFGDFYKDLFSKAWEREGKNVVMLEYAWDISSGNFVKCDPCASVPPTYADLKEAGAFWVSGGQSQWSGSDYNGDVFFTRLHVRYSRENFPQDLFFQETPARENFQGRYVLHRPATGSLDCEAAKEYYFNLGKRRERELQQLASLTGWDVSQYNHYVDEAWRKAERIKEKKNELIPFLPVGGDGEKFPGQVVWLLTFLLFLTVFITRVFSAPCKISLSLWHLLLSFIARHLRNVRDITSLYLPAFNMRGQIPTSLWHSRFPVSGDNRVP